MTDSPTTEIIPTPPLSEIATAILDELHTNCECETCLRRTAETIAQRLVDEFDVRRRVP